MAAPDTWALQTSQLSAAYWLATVPGRATARTQTVAPRKPTPCQAHDGEPALYSARLHEWLSPVQPSMADAATGIYVGLVMYALESAVRLGQVASSSGAGTRQSEYPSRTRSA